MADETKETVVVQERFDWSVALTFFGLGTMVGAAAALLLATQSGLETRQDLRDKYLELKQKVSDLAAQVGDRAKHTVERVRHASSSAVEAGREAAEKEEKKLEDELA